MKKISGIVFFALLISCSSDKNKTTEESVTKPIIFDTLAIGNQVYRSQELTDSNFVFENFESDGTDSLAILKCSPNVARKNDTLILKCDNGRTLFLTNIRSDNDSMRFFSFSSFNKDINAYVVVRSLYEAFDIWLINKQTGDSIISIGLPAVSPDKKKFICFNADLESGFSTNGIQLFKNDNNKYTLLGLREFNDWGPEKAMWKDDTTFIVKAVAKISPDEYRTTYRAIYIK